MSLFDDQNKTEMTKLVTAATCFWLDERGVKPVETEVPIARGWVADIAGVLSPTDTELQDLKLIRRRPMWKKPQEERDAWQKEVSAIRRLMAVVVEVKTSRGDFCGDKKWGMEPLADLNWVATSKGLIKESEWPVGWGVLEYSESRDCMITKQAPVVRHATPDQQLSLVYEVAVRRDNQTRYEHLRRLQKQHRSYDNERTSVTRVKTALRAALSIAKGEHESVEGALEYHGIKIGSAGELEILGLTKLWNYGNRPVPKDGLDGK